MKKVKFRDVGVNSRFLLNRGARGWLVKIPPSEAHVKSGFVNAQEIDLECTQKGFRCFVRDDKYVFVEP